MLMLFNLVYASLASQEVLELYYYLITQECNVEIGCANKASWDLHTTTMQIKSTSQHALYINIDKKTAADSVTKHLVVK